VSRGNPLQGKGAITKLNAVQRSGQKGKDGKRPIRVFRVVKMASVKPSIYLSQTPLASCGLPGCELRTSSLSRSEAPGPGQDLSTRKEYRGRDHLVREVKEVRQVPFQNRGRPEVPSKGERVRHVGCAWGPKSRGGKNTADRNGRLKDSFTSRRKGRRLKGARYSFLVASAKKANIR